MDCQRFREKEKRFYEKIGVRKLKELILSLPLPKIEPRDNSSYFLKRGNGLQDLKEHKKYLYLNGVFHGVAFVCLALSTPPFLSIVICTIQAYLVMLQRYNYIRIKEAVEKHQDHEQQKIKNLKIHILEKDASLRLHKVELYKYQFGKHTTLSESLEDILDHASYFELLYYKKLFNQLEKANQEGCWYSEEFYVPALDGYTSNKTLYLTYDVSKK